jgi:hypothetical protein
MSEASESKRFFFEKKKQKTFVFGGGLHLRGQHRTLPVAEPPQSQHPGLRAEVFCFFFSKKKRFLPSSPRSPQ